MKKYLFLLLVLTLPLLADIDAEMKILDYIVKNINNNSWHKIWSDDAKIEHAFGELGYDAVSNAKDADLIILKEASSLKDEKHIKGKVFVLNYDLLDEIPQSFGAFFWKKGRPNIVFIAPRVENEHLKLSQELQEYEEERVW